MAVQSKIELVVADRLIPLNALTQLLQSQEQAEALRFGRHQSWQHSRDGLKWAAASVRITIGIGLQPALHDDQPTFQPTSRGCVRWRKRATSAAAQLQQPRRKVRVDRLNQLQGQQSDQSHAAWQGVSRGCNRRGDGGQGHQTGPGMHQMPCQVQATRHCNHSSNRASGRRLFRLKAALVEAAATQAQDQRQTEH